MAFLALILPVVLGAIEGASTTALIGTAVLSGLSYFFLRPHQQRPTVKGQSSSWGMPIDIVYNSGRVPGKVIQASQVQEHKNKSLLKKILTGGLTGKEQSNFVQTIAVAFAEGPRTVLRIWADNQVIYDPRPFSIPPQWQANHDYASGDIVIPVGSTGAPGLRQFVATTDGTSGSVEPTWNNTIAATTRDNEIVWQTQKIPKQRKVGAQFKFILRIYNGDEAQLADSALEEIVGTGNQSAYRGLVYVVFEQLNISKFGNRIPNFEAEIVNLFVPIPFYTDLSSPGNGLAFEDMVAQPGALKAYAFVDEQTVPITNAIISFTLAEVSLTSANVLRKSAPISAANLGNDNSQENVGVIAWNVPNTLWRGNGPAGGPTSFDLTTMSNIPTASYAWPGTPTYNNPNYPYAISPDGKTIIGVSWKFSAPNDNILQGVNLTSGAGNVAAASAIGGPTSGTSTFLWVPVFDDTGHIWNLDNKGRLWRTTVAQSGGGAPTLSSMTSFNLNSYGSFSFYGSVSFNPDTHRVTAWLYDNSAGNMRAIDFDTIGLTVVGNHLADDGSAQFTNPDQNGWSNKQFLAATGGVGHTINQVGLYDRNAGTYFQYDWMATWNLPNPTGGINPPHINLFAAIANQTGTAVVSTKSSTSANLAGTVFWYFPLVPGGLTLADIVADVSNRVGLAGQYDYSQLASVIPRGITVMDRMPARAFLESIQPAFFYDLTDIGAQVVGTLRSLSSLSVTIPEADLAATDESSSSQIVDKLTIDRNDDREIPRDLAITYYDYQHDYQQSGTPEIRDPITNYSSGRNTLTVPCVLTPGEAANIAKRVLYLAWIERQTDKCSIPLEYLGITPGDVISPVRNSYGHIVRVTRATLNPRLVIDIEAVSEDLGVYELVQPPALTDQTTGSFTPGQVAQIVPPLLAVLDTAVLDPSQLQEPGVYATVTPDEFEGAFQGATILDSSDNSVFTPVAAVGTPATMGQVVTGPPLPDWPKFTTWDRTNSLQINLMFGQFASASEASLIDNFTNALWMANGEIIQFATAVLIDADSNLWQISDLLRGRLGTESFTGTHGASEMTVLLDKVSVQDVAYQPSTLDQTLYWEAVNDSPIANGTSAIQTLVMTTRRLKPWAPFYIKGTRDGPLNLTITGIRRVRYRGTPLWHPPETDTPITTEVDIMSGASVVRTITATASGGGSVVQDAAAFTVLYTAADQTTDFGSPQASVSVKVYQLNAVRGRGYPGAATI